MNKKYTLLLSAGALIIGIFIVGFVMGRQQPADTKLDRFVDKVKDVGQQAKKDAQKLKNEGKRLLGE